jgi:hypothetical protein
LANSIFLSSSERSPSFTIGFGFYFIGFNLSSALYILDFNNEGSLGLRYSGLLKTAVIPLLIILAHFAIPFPIFSTIELPILSNYWSLNLILIKA